MWRQSFYTHQPILRFYANQATKPILELGCGEGSTRILHEICQQRGLELVTVENNAEWMAKYQDLKTNWHRFCAVPNNGDHNAWEATLRSNGFHEKDWGLVFVDQSPWEARTMSLNLLKNQTDIMVIHDVDYFPEGHKWGRVVRHIAKNVPGLYNFDDQFAKWQLYYPPTPWESPTGPPTLVGSMNPNVVLSPVIPIEVIYSVASK